MAWHYIDMFCGHNERHQIYGPNRDRPRIAAKIARDDCAECREAAILARKQHLASPEALIEAREAAANEGLAPLIGSDKQVVWASEIRARKLAELVPQERDIASRDIASAAWWIDHRNHNGYTLSRELARWREPANA